ncbi:MAG TPA: FtsX-like permease family protein [Pseudomonadales bacterium]|jgi:putative ABC transport system permease protein|nr:FtsX-like permease family protein [Pseudomonadales bacterium]MDP6316066.1 FtsX-like permease family protein [Pseudomonadales bacterium]MDP7316121.1 FtsX-like permease family protein [Pseudomonadales bacterium]HJP51150.1 FtsX-like permease family protein [Pseudomonadales bacterium]|tara:strand:- start:9618 stop:10769 length:1152 start_codon:yes stop_codon:yes gene_type:complete
MKFISLIWAALFRKPVRSLLTLLSIFVAFLLFGLLQSVSIAFSQGISFSGADRLAVAPKYSMTDMMPVSYQNQIKNVKGVKAVSHQTWFGGTYKEVSNFFPRWPVPAKEFLAMYPEYVLPEKQKQVFINSRTGAIVGRSLADEYNLKVGDRIPIIPDIWQNKDNATWEFDLVGIFEGKTDTVEENQMFINFEYFDEYRVWGEGEVGNFMVQIDDSEAGAAIAAEIDALFANSTSETKTSTEKAYAQMFANQVGDIGFIMTSILSAVFFTILLLTGNTMAQAVRERIPELAILKTLGFSNMAVLIIVLAESVFISLLGALPGLALAAAIMPGLGESVPFLGDIKFTTTILTQGVTLALLLGLLVGLPPSLRALRLNIVDALTDS